MVKSKNSGRGYVKCDAVYLCGM